MAEETGRETVTRTLSKADFAIPIEDRYFEDYKTGAIYEYGPQRGGRGGRGGEGGRPAGPTSEPYSSGRFDVLP